MAQLPIRKLTLYKQGIGYFERQGPVEAKSITLVIPHTAINDVLKSLNVEPDSGQVLSVDYETPEDKASLLDNLPVKLDDRSGLVDLLGSLRGSDVTLTLDGEAQLRGRLIGVEASLDPAAQAPTVLLKSEGEVRVVPLTQVHRIILHDERATTDVDYFLDVSRTEQQRAVLTVHLSGNVQNLTISYQAPSPTWRVSYRLVGDDEGQARLIGWGLFDNSLGEDLEEVALTLITGRPISFMYDLYQTRIPSRPHISSDMTELEAIAGHPRSAEMISALSHDLRSPLSSMKGYAELLLLESAGNLTDKQRQFIEQIKRSATLMSELLANLFSIVRISDEDSPPPQSWHYRSGPLGDLKVSSSYFIPMIMGNADQEYLTYEVETPISVKRGQSAMVPIIGESLAYESLCVYNGLKMSNHPLLVWRLQNTTGLALEEGPVTVVEDGRYLGEGLMRFTGVGDDIQIPYALEFGILVSTENETEEKQIAEVLFNREKRQAEVTRYQVTNIVYTLNSHCNREVVVLIERRDPNRGEYFEMPEPEMTLEGHTRWAISVPAQGEVEYTVRIREVTTRSEDVTSWRTSYIEELREADVLPDAVIPPLERMVDLNRQDVADTQEIKALQEERTQVIAGQEQLRQNLKTLGNSARETTIRDRILDDLEGSEDRRREIEARIVELDEAKKTREDERQSLHDEIFEVGGVDEV